MPVHHECSTAPGPRSVADLTGEILIPQTFTRHRRQLRAMLLDDQCWFCTHDLGRLMGQPHFVERVTRCLDDDQWLDVVMLNGYGQPESARLVNESGVYAVLIHYYHPENRCIRRWITRDVVPVLRDSLREVPQCPRRENRQGLPLLHWQGEYWVPYRPL